MRLVQIDLLRAVAVDESREQHPCDDVVGCLVARVDEFARVEGEGVVGRADDFDGDDRRRGERLACEQGDLARLEFFMRWMIRQLFGRRPGRIIERSRAPGSLSLR